MVLHNPNNWHWVNVDASEWARKWFNTNLTGISAEQDGFTAKIDGVKELSGDCDVSQRKGKVVSVFDLELELNYSGIFAMPLSECKAD